MDDIQQELSIKLKHNDNLDMNTLIKSLDSLQTSQKKCFLQHIKNLIENNQMKNIEKSQLMIDQIKKTTQTTFKQKIEQLFSNEIDYLTSIEEKILKTINELMATNKLYLIRQNFRKLILSVLKLDNLETYVFHENGRIQYNNFKQNYVTQILESNKQKRKIIQMILANSSQTTQNVNVQKNPLFAKLFSLNSTKSQKNINQKIQGQISKSNQKYSIIALYTFTSENKQKKFKDFIDKILETIIKISLIEIQQETQYNIIQFYAKDLLDILSMLITNNQVYLKKMLSLQINVEQNQLNTNKDSQDVTSSETTIIQSTTSLKSIESLHDMMRKFSKKQNDSHIIEHSLKYQQFRYELLQRIRMYNKYLTEDGVIFMDFNQMGKLWFLASNRKDQEQLNALLNKLCSVDDLCIEKIFHNNQKIQQFIRRTISSKGQKMNKKLIQVEKGIKVRIIQNEDLEIQRIQVIILDVNDIGSNSSSSTLGASCSIKNKKQSTKSDDVSLGKTRSSKSLLKTIQKQNPGIIEQGWLGLFIKDHQIQRKSKIMLKKKRTLFARDQENNKSASSRILQMQEQEVLKELDIYSHNLNLLNIPFEFLQSFVKKVFSDLKFFERQELDKNFFDNFLRDIQTGYNIHQNPFHNFTHGVNVMHTCYLITNLQKNQNILTPLKIFSTVLSGLCHDVGHTGRTNSFEIASRSKKALTYNDISPLQNYHASLTFQILRRPENNFLQNFTIDQQNQIRKDLISNILFTDIKEHFPLIKKFKSIEFKQGIPLSNQQILIFTGMITHTADFGGSAKEFQICSEWSRRVNIEFMTQYKLQAEYGVPQTPFFKDLDNYQIMAKNEMGFLKVIVFPLYEALSDFYQNDQCMTKLKCHIETNIKSWQEVHLKKNNSTPIHIDSP